MTPRREKERTNIGDVRCESLKHHLKKVGLKSEHPTKLDQIVRIVIFDDISFMFLFSVLTAFIFSVASSCQQTNRIRCEVNPL